jgi:hypothetical protein
LAFALQLRKKHGKTSVRIDECVNYRESITAGSEIASAKIPTEETNYDGRAIIRTHLNA